MKVLLINGSPHENGCTDAALKVLSEEFFKQGIGTVQTLGNASWKIG